MKETGRFIGEPTSSTPSCPEITARRGPWEARDRVICAVAGPPGASSKAAVMLVSVSTDPRRIALAVNPVGSPKASHGQCSP